MTRSILLLILASSAALVIGYSLAPAGKVAGPSVLAPDFVELGLHDVGKLIVTTLMITNRGDGELNLKRKSVSCGCLQMEARIDGSSSDADQIALPPGGSVELLVRLSVGSAPRPSLLESVSFTTNDPSRPILNIQFHAELQGAMVAKPTEVLLRNLKPGEELRLSIRIQHRDRVKPFELEEIRSTLAGVVDVEGCTAISGLGAGESAESEVRIRVRAPATPQAFTGFLEVIEDEKGTPALRIPVHGESVAPVGIQPPVLVLPRFESGKSTYSGKAVCRSSRSVPFTLKLIEAPAGCRVRLSPLQDDTAYLIVVEVDKATAETADGPATITLRAEGEGIAETVSMSVRFWRPK